jgi:hypothetical protein
MMVLARSIRDNSFHEHRKGESVTVIRKTPRSDFDPTLLLIVSFENGVQGALLERDVENVGPLPVLGQTS